ncbi:hypothetical protein F0L68_15845 [Solihabitans fulvus]|uniref:Uncharacterized protein n=1 Tax=Solihabitans fulvus TaxID=1892852 RepID=A0A5B2XF86_9PSEU|nr:hypothetical protein [Solihabitans fulvus]KAA2261715.1 hypothetical protein F0L68_15845 [Solihabitans fulvus]
MTDMHEDEPYTPDRHHSDILRAQAALEAAGDDVTARGSAYAAMASAFLGLDRMAREGDLPAAFTPDPSEMLENIVEFARDVLKAETPADQVFSGADMEVWLGDLTRWIESGGELPEEWQD